MARVYESLNIDNGVIECLSFASSTRAIALSDRIGVVLQLACFQAKRMQYKDAIKSAQVAINYSRKQSAAAYLLMAICYTALRDWKNASNALNASFALDASQTLLNHLLAELHIASNDFQQAESDALFELDAIARNASSIHHQCNTYYLLAVLAKTAKVVDRARVYIQRAIRIDPLQERFMTLLQSL
jgi:tetratricopeptide (TPR) repeat protein